MPGRGREDETVAGSDAAEGAQRADFSDYEAARGTRAAPPDSSAGETSLARQMRHALEEMRKAPANRRSRREALHRSPWLMVIGRDEESSASLLRCGLHAPLREPEPADASGGPWWRWWTFDRFVGIEATPALIGRAADTSSASPPNSAVNLLIRERRNWPLDGLVLTLDTESLSAGGPGIEEFARNARRFVNLCYETMGIRFPVFLCCVGIERLFGHDRFFSAVPNSVATNALGYRIPEAVASERPAEGLRQGFDDVVDRLKRARLSILAEQVEPAEVQGLFEFPERFAGMRSGVHALAGQLLEAGPNDHSPMFRGLYFVATTAVTPHVAGLFDRFLPADVNLGKELA